MASGSVTPEGRAEVLQPSDAARSQGSTPAKVDRYASFSLAQCERTPSAPELSQGTRSVTRGVGSSVADVQRICSTL